jgi:NAD(P)-dependent dehydrogenase (short-subunit alcohol dehydrogenase family)
MTSLANQTVLVTGANRGMGREYVAQLLDREVRKVYAAARDPRTIDVEDPRVVPLQVDVTDATSVAESAEPAEVVRQVLDGIESGADEVLADEMTRVVRARLNKPIRERLS